MFKQTKRSFELQSSLYSNQGADSIHPFYNHVKRVISELEEKIQKYEGGNTIGYKLYPYSYVAQVS